MEETRLILMFNISKFDRHDLDRMSDRELCDTAATHSDDDTQVYEWREFCEACNDQEITDMENWWLYAVTKTNK